MKVFLKICCYHGLHFPHESAPVWGVEIHDLKTRNHRLPVLNVDPEDVKVSHGMCPHCAKKENDKMVAL